MRRPVVRRRDVVQTTRASRKRRIASESYPISASSASVCSPRGGRRTIRCRFVGPDRRSDEADVPPHRMRQMLDAGALGHEGVVERLGDIVDGSGRHHAGEMIEPLGRGA